MTGLQKPLNKIAIKCFRNLQRAMGDRKSAAGEAAALIRRNLDLALREPLLRDELYLQAIKQITDNPNGRSLMNGWEVLCVYSTTFPPSKNLIPSITQEISAYDLPLNQEQRDRASSEDLEDPEVMRYRMALMARFIKANLAKLARTGPRGHLPTLEEIDSARSMPFRHRVFGVPLEDIMEVAENRDATGLYPRVLTFLAESILKLGGTTAEGIFRVPGFIDEVQMLRLRIERGQYSIDGIADPSTPASLLKLWLRELTDPIIPHSFYERCLLVGSDVDEAIAILDEIPPYNRNVLKYLIKFLQVVGDPRYQEKTKMSINNIAMVFAPNILRCPSDNPLVILANSKFEQNFLKALINYLED